ncbi:hypothetical protein PROFUN_13220 [Planoprotostelium fungivorum]|uniref:Uncharacterized protein n=1 Tax=Planoprotostelium fungivorum TaxID=1890364 RepID=A0A2P6MYX5_9EUKA|nr:hypothetical protein PROFUN_13220 [Planoprotostelium fungivorum]
MRPIINVDLRRQMKVLTQLFKMRWYSFAVSQPINQTDNIIDYDAIMENLLPFRRLSNPPKQLRKRMWLFN